MKIILTFFWIAIGAVLLWFFAENLDQSVSIKVFTRTYEHVNLVTVIFVSTFLGLLLGALLMTLRIIKEKARAAGFKRENKRLNKEIEKLNSKLDSLNKEIESLNQELIALREEKSKDVPPELSSGDAPKPEPQV